MQITLPTDCGNAPRIAIVGEFAANWATGETAAVAEWLTDDANWSLIGAGTHSGPEAAGQVIPQFLPDHVEVTSIITHGRLASCDGHLEAGERRISFSHALRFATTSKTAKIAEVRSYCIETRSEQPPSE